MDRTRLLALLAAPTLAATMLGTADAQSVTSVRGRVVDCYRNAPVSATVTLIDDGGFRWSAKTDGNGRFSLLAPLEGVASLEVEQPGYQSNEVDFRAGDGEAVTVNVVLTRELRVSSHPLAQCTAQSMARFDPPTEDRYIIR